MKEYFEFMRAAREVVRKQYPGATKIDVWFLLESEEQASGPAPRDMVSVSVMFRDAGQRLRHKCVMDPLLAERGYLKAQELLLLDLERSLAKGPNR